MNRMLKTFLVWILMAVLPLHAVAAAVSMSCAPVHHQDAQAPIGLDLSHHDLVADAHAHHADRHASDTADSATDAHSPVGKIEKQSHSSCSACSAFCVGAVAPPSTNLPLPVLDGSDAVVVSPADLVAGFIPDGLQRPPRHQSA
ncbi:hypothetical protein [Massilia niastensis]|uniref:hypothetical protein n=1 Tax=Massilia niastensis TaxID=544911 RepID=UPI0012EBCE43|nr:hypothetical protein [Massilia niastensis]